MNEDLRKWFREKWVRMDTKGNIKGDCAREEGEGKPKCLPLAKAQAMDKKDRAAATRRKRREDPVADRSGKGGKPINVATEEVSTSELIKASHSKRGAPGTLKAKIKGRLTLAKVRALKNRPNATTLDKKQANFYINMQSEQYIDEGNQPTNPALWSKAKALARSKFDVYPSAYANGWAAKWYKSKGGGWKAMDEQMEPSTPEIRVNQIGTARANAQISNLTANLKKRKIEQDAVKQFQKDQGVEVKEQINPYTEVLEQLDGRWCNVCGQTPCNCTDIKEAKATYCGRCGTTHVAPKFGGTCPALKKEEVENVAEVSDKTLINYLTKVHNDSLKHDNDPTKRSAEKRNKSVMGFSRAFNKLDARKGVAEEVEHQELVTELKTSTLQSYVEKRAKGRISSLASTIGKPAGSPEQKRYNKQQDGVERARKKLAPHYAAQAAEHANKQKEELKKNNPPEQVAKKMAAVKKEYEQSHGPIEKSGHQYAEGNGYYHGKELHQRYHALKQLHKTVSEQHEINEFLPIIAAIGRAGVAGGRVLGTVAGRALAGAARVAGNALPALARGVSSVASTAVQGASALASKATSDDSTDTTSSTSTEKKKKTTASNMDYVPEAMSAQHRFALALQRERERRELKDKAREAREASAKPVSFQSYVKPKGNTDEKTN